MMDIVFNLLKPIIISRLKSNEDIDDILETYSSLSDKQKEILKQELIEQGYITEEEEEK